MADCSTLLSLGIQQVQQATEKDKLGDHKEALRLYSLALESFVSVMRYEKNDKIKIALRPKIAAYMERAEQLKVLIAGSGSPSHVSLPPPTATSPRTGPALPLQPTTTTGTLHAQSIKIKQGQIGCSYDTLFGRYFTGASIVFVEDPYIRSDHQIYNFLRLCETIIKRIGGGECLVHLMTSCESPEQKRDLEAKMSELKISLQSHNLQLVLTYNDAMHDREIRMNNGWIIKIGRGLDFYAKPQSKFSVGFCDLDLRPCLETAIDIFKDNNS